MIKSEWLTEKVLHSFSQNEGSVFWLNCITMDGIVWDSMGTIWGSVQVCVGSVGQYIENTRWVSFDIKFTRQDFENACWHREACRAIQHAFSKPSLVNLISKDANLVFYLSVYPLLNTLQTSDYGVIFWCLCWFSVISDVIQKVQRHHDLIKVACREIGNVY